MLLPTPKNEYDRQLLGVFKKSGFAIIGISWRDRPDVFQYAFSMGLSYSFGVSEVAMYGVPNGIMEQAIEGYAAAAKSGVKIPAGKPTQGVLGAVKVYLKDIRREMFPKYFGYLGWFYQNDLDSHTVRQLFLPDRNDKYPWEKGCDMPVRGQLDFDVGKHW